MPRDCWRRCRPSLRSTGPGTPMYWAIYKEIYMEHVVTTCRADSEHPLHVRKVLDRFTAYLGLAESELSAIDNRDLATYVQRRRQDEWRGKPLQPRTINNEIDILNTAFAKAGPRERGAGRGNFAFISDAPFHPRLQEFARMPVCLEWVQIERLVEAARCSRSPHQAVCCPSVFWPAAVLLELTTRLRRRALLRVPRPSDELLLERREIRVPAEFDKNGIERVYALGSDETGGRVARILHALPTRLGEPLLPWRRGDGRPMSLGHFSNAIAAMQRRAGICESQRVRLKDIRSTGATLISDRFGDAVAKKAIGHSPNTNTINTNYKNRLPREADRAASDMMAAPILDRIDRRPEPDGPATIRFPGGAA
ncbi:MAG: hypothetical protein KF861_09915 [Planctomycetaceae bacterium]|nr:hypothetical protein [Planctomycetaceae bacterium]